MRHTLFTLALLVTLSCACTRNETTALQTDDLVFLPDNDALYCTELVQTAYLTADGEQLFKSEPMNFKGPDGTMPPYWEWLFARLGRSIPQDEPGTNPQRMAADPALHPVDIDLTQCVNRWKKSSSCATATSAGHPWPNT